MPQTFTLAFESLEYIFCVRCKRHGLVLNMTSLRAPKLSRPVYEVYSMHDIVVSRIYQSVVNSIVGRDSTVLCTYSCLHVLV